MTIWEMLAVSLAAPFLLMAGWYLVELFMIVFIGMPAFILYDFLKRKKEVDK